MTRIDDSAFSYCKQLNEVDFENNSQLHMMGKDVFKNCLTPMDRRSHPFFSRYFNQIWQELSGEE